MVTAVAIALSVLWGCAADPCGDSGMLASDQGLIVTEQEHPTGWGQAECAACHAFAALHRQGCTQEVDLAAVRAIVDAEGTSSCAGCHGDNGVSP